MKRSLFVLFLAAAACTKTPPPQVIPQQVYCVTPDQYKALVDAEPPKVGNSLSDDSQVANVQQTAQNILVRRYADGLLKVLGGCIGHAPSDA